LTRRPPEPSGRLPGARLAYAIQKHDASHLHYDFRLELDGVLKSWAVPKGPSTDPADKRLAVQVGDHSIAYGGFEGVIPRGYGAGTVMLWDRGWWEPEGDPAADYADGHLRFTIHGERLRGGWSLVRLGTWYRSGRQQNWLLIKARDAAATPGTGSRLIERETTSVASHREMAAIAAGRRPPRAARDEAQPELPFNDG
jgi:bifunctional non-homologous end joining protein LigD